MIISEPMLGLLMLMVVLVVFARLTKTAPRHFVAPLLVLMWSVLLITVASAALLFTAGFFDWPRPLFEILSEAAPAPKPEELPKQEGSPAPSVAVARAIQVSRRQSDAGDLAGAWETLAAVAGTGSGPELEHEQARLAMARLREGRPGPGRTFTQLDEPLLPALHRAAVADAGAGGADVLAHIGWGHFLESRDGTGGLEIEPLYEQAIARDPNNPYAHAMWGHWILWRSADFEAAEAHFEKALASGREGAWVRSMALSANQNRDALAPMARVLIAMHEAGDRIDPEQRNRIASRLYYSNNPKSWRDLSSSVDAGKHLAMFKWLTTPEDLTSHAWLAHRRAQLEGAVGNCAEAEKFYRTLLGRGLSFASDDELRAEAASCTATAQ